MASWDGFDDPESGIAFYEYYFGPQCITAKMYCGSADCVASSGGSCVHSAHCDPLLNTTLVAAFRFTRGLYFMLVDLDAHTFRHRDGCIILWNTA